VKLINFVFATTLVLANHLVADEAIVFSDDFFEPKTTIGGYGELHYNNSTQGDNDAKKTLDFHRFVMFYSHSWTEQWSFKAEIELEHNFVQDGQGELELEQAYVNYQKSAAFGFQVGVILPAVGLLNEHHEPPLFFSVERPDYAKVIIPTTWFGNGLAVYGRLSSFDYKLVVMEGLDAAKISSSSGIRNARLKGYKASADEYLYNAQVNYRGLPGLRAGLSLSTTTAMGNDVQEDIPLTLVEFHSQIDYRNIIAAFEYGNISYGAGNLESSRGYYVDLGYNLAPLFHVTGDLIPWARLTSYNTAAQTVVGGDELDKYNYSKWMTGVTYKPIKEVSFKIDYSVKLNALSNEETTVLNLGAGYQF
jgi:hypothetical protein